VGLLVGLMTNVQACIWDHDTLAMETREFPEALDLITGKFLRHSPVYYRWRLEDRQAQLIQNPNDLSLYDDLATAHDKLGRSDLAIAIMLKKYAIQPGLYETEANLGTFYIHNKQFQDGLIHIKRAIEINPDAHFGREIYQQQLVEYVVEKSRSGDLSLPLNREDAYMKIGFAKWVSKDAMFMEQYKQELAKAEKGVLGMMRFGHYDSPILLEALGDLLITKGDARRLACRAYLKASYECTDEDAKQAYCEKAAKALRTQTKNEFTTEGLTLAEVEESFASELDGAREWYSAIEKNESDWAAKGLNLDDEFKARYYK
jgi:tetratricopeptide (TPR) repeat protein